MSVDFIDSNVFIYLFDDVNGEKREKAEGIVAAALSKGSAVISFQVVQECMNVLVKTLGAPPEDVLRFVDSVLAPLWKVAPSVSLYREAVHVQARYRFAFLDSLIVAAALEAGCSRLLSEDLQHGQQIGDLTVVNPFG